MELSSDAKIRKIKDAAESAQTTISSDAVDMGGFKGVILFTTIATVSANANYIKAEQADETDATWYDIDGATVTPITDGDLVWIDISAPKKRYVRLSVVRAGAAFATSEIFAVQYASSKRPVDNIDNGIIGVVSESGAAATWPGIIITPTITSPESGEIDIALDATVTGSEYATVGSEALHEKSQFQITAAADTEFLTPIVDVEVSEGTLTEYTLAGRELDSEHDYLIRVRYFTTTLGWSDWSVVVDFNTISSGLAITSITPNEGPNTGGTAITIEGAEFVAGIGVKVNNVACTSVVRVSATELTCVTPAGDTGAQAVKITNTDGGTVTEAEGFTFISVPTITELDVTEGPNTGGTAVTITGTEFAEGVAVTFGGVTATSIVVVSGTSITCATPAGSAGEVDVVVTNSDGGTVTATDGYEYTA